jgi:hypothetical protein
MLTLIKLLRSLFKTLHSDGSPSQLALGIALGAALGLTPIANAHNLLVVLLLAVLNVSFAAGMLAWAVFVPIGFMFDPIFDRVGRLLLVDTIVLGSVVVWLLLFVPLYFAARYGVVRYRATIGDRIVKSKYFKLLQASQVYNVYRWFNP